MRARVIVFLGCFVLCGRAAQGQTVPPRLEVGGSGGALLASGNGDGVFILTLGPRLTFNATARDAVEIVAELVGPVESDGLNGLYLLQYKRGLVNRAADRMHVFLTAGAGGGFAYHRTNEYRDERPDGSVLVYPAHTHASLGSPMFVAGGIGFERVHARYIATRSDLQIAVFRFRSVGVRGTFGVSIPIGGYRDK